MRVLFLASTYPRWKGDSSAPFIQELAQATTDIDSNISIEVIAPHSKNAVHDEFSKDNKIHVKRIQYAYPASIQGVFYDGGAASKKKGIGFALQSISYITLLFLHTLYIAIFKKIDVIHAHWIIPQGTVAVLVGKITRTPVLVTVHGGDIFTMRGKLPTIIKRFTLRFADAVTVNSSLTEQACRSVYDRKYEFGPMGIAMDQFRQATHSKTGKIKRIIYVGRIAEEKGIQFLIDALPDIRGKFEVDIVGDGPYMNEIRTQVSQSPYEKQITIHGWVDRAELAKLYQKADVFVGASITLANGWQEAMGVVYIEALASGVPVITTKSTGAKDFVTDGVNGYIIDEKDSKAIADAVNKTMNTQFNQQEFNAKIDYIKQTYSWPECAKRFTGIYEKL